MRRRRKAISHFLLMVHQETTRSKNCLNSVEEEMSLQKVLCNRHILQVLLSPSEFPVSYSKVQPAAEHVLHFQPLMALAAAAHKEQAAVLPWSGRRRHSISAWPKLLGHWHNLRNWNWLLSGKQPILHPRRETGSNYLPSGHRLWADNRATELVEPCFLVVEMHPVSQPKEVGWKHHTSQSWLVGHPFCHAALHANLHKKHQLLLHSERKCEKDVYHKTCNFHLLVQAYSYLTINKGTAKSKASSLLYLFILEHFRSAFQQTEMMEV